MSQQRHFARLRRTTRESHRAPRPHFRRLRSEPLEDRRMLAVVTVDNNLDLVNGDTSSIVNLIASDGGDGITLREALEATNNTVGADNVLFDSALSGQTILLGGTELVITEAATVNATSLAAGFTIDAQENSRIINITAASGDFTFAGLTLTGGRTTGYASAGGAINSITNGHLTIDRSTISNNSTTGTGSAGGGIRAFGTMSLIDSVVSDNSTLGELAGGGGIRSSDMTITNSIISGNSTAGNDAYGGGIRSSDMTITNSTISGNSTAGDNAYGGGIRGNLMTIIDSTISGNSTLGNFAHGGGVFAAYAILTRSTVSDNSTSGYSAHGAGVGSTSNVLLTNSTVSGNSTSGGFSVGAGILGVNAVTIYQSTVTDNHTLFANTAGGGVFADNDLTIANSIISANTTGGSNPDLYAGSGIVDVNYTIIGNTSGLSGGDLANINAGMGNLLNVNPMLDVLSTNGGPTETHRLLVTSPAIDAGDPTIVFNPAESDQRGAPNVRVFDGDAMAGARIDIGAYEVQPLVFVVDTVVDESDSNYSLWGFSLREATELANAHDLGSTIQFDASLAGLTIALALGELPITNSVNIVGLGPDQLTIDAGGMSRIFNVDDGNAGNVLDVEISGMTLTGGAVAGAGSVGSGGAILLYKENLTVRNALITANTAARGGGISATLLGPTLTIENTTLSGNVATASNGGAINVFQGLGGTTTITQSTIAGNMTVDGGGGVFVYGGVGANPTTISHSTITDNISNSDNAGPGGSGGFSGVLASVFILDHTIVAGNTDGAGMLSDIGGTIIAQYSLIGNDSGLPVTDNGGNQIGTPGSPIDPLLGPLQDNGGPTPTHAPLPGSPVIGAGDLAAIAGMGGVPTFDERGAPFARVVGGQIDIGAVESEDAPLPGDGNGQVDGLDYLLWASHFGDDPAQDPPGSPANGDFNNDGKVDGLDYLVWANNFGTGTPAVPAAETLGPATSTPSQEDLAAIAAALEDEYDTGATVADPRTEPAWQASWAFDSVFDKLTSKRRDHRRIRAAI